MFTPRPWHRELLRTVLLVKACDPVEGEIEWEQWYGEALKQFSGIVGGKGYEGFRKKCLRFVRAKRGQGGNPEPIEMGYLLLALVSMVKDVPLAETFTRNKPDAVAEEFIKQAEGFLERAEVESLVRWKAADRQADLGRIIRTAAYFLAMEVADVRSALAAFPPPETGDGQSTAEHLPTPTPAAEESATTEVNNELGTARALVDEPSVSAEAHEGEIDVDKPGSTNPGDEPVDDSSSPALQFAAYDVTDQRLIGAEFKYQLVRIIDRLTAGSSVQLYGPGAAGKSRLVSSLVAEWPGGVRMLDCSIDETTLEAFGDLFDANTSQLGEVIRAAEAFRGLIVVDDYFRIQDERLKVALSQLVRRAGVVILVVNQSRIPELDGCLSEEIARLVSEVEVRQLLEGRAEFAGKTWPDSFITQLSIECGGHPGRLIVLARLYLLCGSQGNLEDLLKRNKLIDAKQKVDGVSLENRLLSGLLNAENEATRNLLQELALVPEPWQLDWLSELPSFDDLAFIRLLEAGYIVRSGTRFHFDLNPLRELLARRFETGERRAETCRVVFTHYYRRVTEYGKRSWSAYRYLMAYAGEEDHTRIKEVLLLFAEESSETNSDAAVTNFWLSPETTKMIGELGLQERAVVLVRIGKELRYARRSTTLQQAQRLLSDFSLASSRQGQAEAVEVRLIRLENSYRLYRQTRLPAYSQSFYNDFGRNKMQATPEEQLLEARVRIGLLEKPSPDLLRLIEHIRTHRRLRSGLSAAERLLENRRQFDATLRLIWYHEKAHHSLPHLSRGQKHHAAELVKTAMSMTKLRHGGWEEDVFMTLLRVNEIDAAFAFAKERMTQTVSHVYNGVDILNRVIEAAIVFDREDLLDDVWVPLPTRRRRKIHIQYIVDHLLEVDKPLRYWLIDRLRRLGRPEFMVNLIGDFNPEAWYLNSMAVCESMGHAHWRMGNKHEACRYFVNALLVSDVRQDEVRRTRIVEFMRRQALFDLATVIEMSKVAKVLLLYRQSDLWGQDGNVRGLQSFIKK